MNHGLPILAPICVRRPHGRRVLACALLAACSLPPSSESASESASGSASESASGSGSDRDTADSRSGLDTAGDTGPLGPTDTGADTEASRCTVTDTHISCEHHTTTLHGAEGDEPREVHWQVPAGTAPASGWPAVMVFQGAYFPADHNWAASVDDPYGAWYQVQATRSLLDAGYAVLTPETLGDGHLYWLTNIAPYATAWSTSSDHALVQDLFTGVEQGTFGDLDPDRLAAAGFSSGGYMASRVGITWPERFRALAIHSASYATCLGSACAVPPQSADHPPTLFLHGELDLVVPMWTMTLYRDALDSAGVETSTRTSAEASHEWIEAAPETLLDWFERLVGTG